MIGTKIGQGRTTCEKMGILIGEASFGPRGGGHGVYFLAGSAVQRYILWSQFAWVSGHTCDSCLGGICRRKGKTANALCLDTERSFRVGLYRGGDTPSGTLGAREGWCFLHMAQHPQLIFPPNKEVG